MSRLDEAKDRLFRAVDAYKADSTKSRTWYELAEACEVYAAETAAVRSSPGDEYDRLASLHRRIGVLADYAASAAYRASAQHRDDCGRTEKLRQGIADVIGIANRWNMGVRTDDAICCLRAFIDELLGKAPSRWDAIRLEQARTAEARRAAESEGQDND